MQAGRRRRLALAAIGSGAPVAGTDTAVDPLWPKVLGPATAVRRPAAPVLGLSTALAVQDDQAHREEQQHCPGDAQRSEQRNR